MKYIMYRISIGDFTYIGSTKDFKQRKRNHKSDCNKKELKVYQIIREQGGWDKCEMVPIEEIECESKLDALMREEHWRMYHHANMNVNRAYITEEQKMEQHKKWSKAHHDANKEKEQSKHTCGCGGKYTHMHKLTHEKTQKHTKYLEEQNLIPI